MFGYKKNKKQNTIYTGSYVVKDTDNIISIAQSYNVPWKELAEVNNIEPPYILISGETISVPGKNSDVFTEEAPNASNIEPDKHSKEQTNKNNVQAHQSNGVVANNIKTNTTTPHSTKKSTQQQDVITNNKKVVRKVTYASPKNMLHRPSAEPTTQSIDIEWMQDDETAYSEEIQLQKKKINIRLIIISIFIVAIIGIIVWRGAILFLKQKDNKNVSVQTLIEKNEIIEKNKVEKKDIPLNDNDKNKQDNEELIMEGGKDLSQTKDDAKEMSQNEQNKDKQNKENISVGEITIQVLNAGAQTGAAADVTKVFANHGYKILTARNAKNSYKGVVIYYSASNRGNIDIVAREIEQKYGKQKYEESDEVTKKYGADFVVVLGS